jgi:retinol dehydrogenase-12
VHSNTAKVILACRSVEKGEKAKTENEAKEGKSGVAEVWQVDLGSFDSIKDVCSRVNALPRRDAFINNAGLQTFTYEDYEGYKRQVTVHVITPFLMTLLLLPIMRKTKADFQSDPHTVIVSSNGHMYTKFEPCSAESVFEAVRGDHDMRLRYYDTKLMAVSATRELAKRLKLGERHLVVLNMVDPRYCQSHLLRAKELEWPIRVIMAVADKVLARTPEMGARTYIMASNAGLDSHGKYLEDSEQYSKPVCGF